MASDQRPSSAQSNVGDDNAKDFPNTYPGIYSSEETKKKILEICKTLWPSADHDDTYVDYRRERGKVAQYLIGINYVPWSKKQGLFDEYYVLEIPHRLDTVVEHENVLRFVDTLTPEAVRELAPDIFHADSTRQNPLGWPYMVLTKRRGASHLGDAYHFLSQEQKLKIAAQLGRIFREVQTARSWFCGYPDIKENETAMYKNIKKFPILSKEDADVEEDQIDWDAMLDALRDPKGDLIQGYMNPGSTFNRSDFFGRCTILNNKAHDAMRQSFLRWMHRLRYCKGPRPEKEDGGLLDLAWPMVQEIMRRNPDVFSSSQSPEDDFICLRNENLADPSNIEVIFGDGDDDGIVADQDGLRIVGEPRITDVRDWDATAFEPRFAGCRPPAWLWAFPDPKESEQIKESTLSVFNLPRKARWSDVRAAFSQFGRVTQVSGNLIGYAYVSLASPEAAAEAIRQTNGLCLRLQEQTSDDTNTSGCCFFEPPPPKPEGTRRSLAGRGLIIELADPKWIEHIYVDLGFPRHERLEPLEAAAVEPTHTLAAEVKRAFDEAAGPAFCAAAYGADMVLVRRFWQVVRDRPWRTGDWDELRGLVKRAEAVRPSGEGQVDLLP